MSSTQKPASMLIIGIDENLKELISSISPGLNLYNVANFSDFEKLLETPPQDQFLGIICGNNIPEVSLQELAQSMRSMYIESTILYLTKSREEFDRKTLVKNGFSEIFLLPLDAVSFRERFIELTSANNPKAAKIFKPVKLIDLQPDVPLGFDVSIRMALNGKYIKLASSDDAIDAAKLEKLQKHGVSSMYVPKEQMPQFYSYFSNRLNDLSTPGKISETERVERLQNAIRELISDVFNFNSAEASVGYGMKLLKESQNIVSTFILNSNPGEWYKSLNQAMGDEVDTYSHTSRVSTVAVLFGIGLQLEKPSELATAGLFHDLGLADVPESILAKPKEQWTQGEFDLYKLHVEASIKFMKERRLAVPDSVIRSIMEHHERFDGTGYPKGLAGKRISIGGQLLGLADEFDYLTAQKDGKKGMTPVEALNEIRSQGHFDYELLNKILALLPKE